MAAETTPVPKSIYDRRPFLKLIVDKAEGRVPCREGETVQFPDHVAIIMDGNRRFIRSKEGPDAEPIKGHIEGMQNMIGILRDLRQLPIKYVTLWAFSPENWDRDPKEVEALMGLFAKAIPEVLPELQANNGRFIHLGRTDRINPEVVRALEIAEVETVNNTGQTVCLGIDYGGQDQEVRVLQEALRMAQLGRLPEGFETNEYELGALRKRLLDTGDDIPPIDLVFRTGGEQRTSGLPNADYAEFYRILHPLPNATIDDFIYGLVEYSRRTRRFGKDGTSK